MVLAMPAGDLPDRMRGEFARDERVRVTIENDQAEDWDALIAEIGAFRKANPHPVDAAEAVARIRILRDEWK
ncbi:hypothetical protein [Aurantimonas sp. Leaf443]|uniref:hypothetical protein n=1 Tax=Aurantimonas sp. Leaf443 TaxID=1736378 RepID=UPI0012E3F091|nr:hypothetical protein [Aurantimonas sp. Leaf443]